ILLFFFFFSSRRRHTRFSRDWSSDVCSSDLPGPALRCSRRPDISGARTAADHRLLASGGRGAAAHGAGGARPARHGAGTEPCSRSEERRVGKEYNYEELAEQNTKRKQWNMSL